MTDYSKLVEQARELLRNWRDEVPVHVRRAAPLLVGLADAVEQLQLELKTMTGNRDRGDLVNRNTLAEWSKDRVKIEKLQRDYEDQHWRLVNAQAEVARLTDGIREALERRKEGKEVGSTLRRALRDVAGEDGNKFQCPCGRKFDTLLGLHVHQGHQHHYNKEDDGNERWGLYQ